MKKKRKSRYHVAIGRRGGNVISKEKSMAARENGKLGGRPRKQT